MKVGIAIRDYVTRPAEVRVLEPAPELPPRVPPIRTRKHIPDRWIEIVLHEGRNRQVRRMTAAVGFPTLRLVRVAIGDIGLELDGPNALAPGQWREVAAPSMPPRR